jgi:hypothetical protein
VPYPVRAPIRHGCAAGEGFFKEMAMYDMANLKKAKRLVSPGSKRLSISST